MSLNIMTLGGSPGRYSMTVSAQLALFSPSHRGYGGAKSISDEPDYRVGMGDEHFMKIIVLIRHGGEASGEALGDLMARGGFVRFVSIEERHPRRGSLIH